MARKKTFASRLLIILLSFILVLSFPFTVSAADGVGTWWDGIVSIQHLNGDMYLTYSHDTLYNDTNSQIKPNEVNATFSGSANMVVDIEMYDTDVYLNGYLRKRLSFTSTGGIPENATLGYLNVVGQPIVTDSYFISIQPVSRIRGGTTDVDVYVYFNNYYVNNTNLRIPLLFDLSLNVYYNTNNTQYFNNIIGTTLNVTEDWYGDMWQYDNLEDVPSMDGYFAEQNQQIIDNSQTQIQNQQTQIQQQEQANQLQQESNEQNKSFMDNFFSNLGNTVLSWIVPSSEQITGFFNEVNSWFSERLGFVWYPFDLAIQLVTALSGGSADTGFTVPAFSLNFQGQQLNIWNSFEVDIDAFGIFQYVRFFTSALLVCGIVKMAIDKWDEWIGGHNQ